MLTLWLTRKYDMNDVYIESCISVSTVQATAASINHLESASDTNAGPIAQTTIPYDDEFDLVCDL
jgi:hypothetical protein